MIESVLTHAARTAQTLTDPRLGANRFVVSSAQLKARGIGASAVSAQLAARRWQRRGLALVLHNGPLTQRQRCQVALINCGQGSALTAFTAAEWHGLRDWQRSEVHLVAGPGARRNTQLGSDVRLHRTTRWPLASPAVRVSASPAALRLHDLAPALVIATSTFSAPRPACGLLAAAVQQRLLSASDLQDAIVAAPRTRHRAALLSAVEDIEGGSQALSEIDFVRLCRKHGLPPPVQQQVRREPSGRRRYLDATWRRADGRLVVVEVDGALHLSPQRWWDDQLRQNELALVAALVLRFPSVVLRCEEATVVRQLREALSVSL